MENIYEFITNIISNTSSIGLILNCLLIIIESILPPLPLGFFVTILFINYGPILGTLISWMCTIIGCIISYYLFQTIFKNIIDIKIIVISLFFSSLILLILFLFL